jgi:hypothetical protein
MSHDTRTIQIAVTEEQYQALATLAARDHKTIEIIAHEAVEKACFAEAKRARIRQAAATLLELAKTADVEPPDDYHEWEEEYSRLKWDCHGSDK